jgi:hypothetical protein
LRVGSTVCFHTFSDTISQNTVIVVSGESARQSFFSAKSLDLTEGFKVLSGAVSAWSPGSDPILMHHFIRIDTHGSGCDIGPPDQAHFPDT